MLRVPLNLASRPFFNNRKFYAFSLLLGLALVVLSAANLFFYLAHRSQSLRLNRELANQTAEATRLEKEQQDIWARLQQPETEDFLNLVDYLNPLIAQRTILLDSIPQPIGESAPPPGSDRGHHPSDRGQRNRGGNFLQRPVGCRLYRVHLAA